MHLQINNIHGRPMFSLCRPTLNNTIIIHKQKTNNVHQLAIWQPLARQLKRGRYGCDGSHQKSYRTGKSKVSHRCVIIRTKLIFIQLWGVEKSCGEKIDLLKKRIQWIHVITWGIKWLVLKRECRCVGFVFVWSLIKDGVLYWVDIIILSWVFILTVVQRTEVL